MYRGKVTKVDSAGVYVQTAEFGVIGPCQAVVANYAVGDMVLCVNVGDEASPELVVVGRLTGTGSTTSGSSVDNTVARYNGTGGALQTSGVTIDDSNNVTSPGEGATFGPASATRLAYHDAYIQGVSLWPPNDTYTLSKHFGFLKVDGSRQGGFGCYMTAGGGGAASFWWMGEEDFGSSTKTLRVSTDGTVTIRAASKGLEFGSSGPRIMAGTGSPESVVSAPVGSLWLRTDSSTTLYVKQTGTGNTGWIAK